MISTPLNFVGVEEADVQHVRAVIQRGENFKVYTPSHALDLVAAAAHAQTSRAYRWRSRDVLLGWE